MDLPENILKHPAYVGSAGSRSRVGPFCCKLQKWNVPLESSRIPVFLVQHLPT